VAECATFGVAGLRKWLGRQQRHHYVTNFSESFRQVNVHPVILFLVGLGVIILGAEVLLRGASRIAAMLGLRPILIGLTVVALGTSAPELAVGITAVNEGRGSMAVGNIAGTNILNILFILGLSAAIRPLPLQLSSIRLDVPVMLAAALALLAMAWDGVLTRVEGTILVLAAVGYTLLLIRVGRSETPEVKEEFSQEYSPEALNVRRGWLQGLGQAVLLAGGIALTIVGADWMVDGAVKMAQSLGVSDAIIGLTVIAIGTSAPELVTTIISTIKNDRDVAVGNLIGSSISNILVILGLTCLVAPNGVDVSSDVLWIDLPLGAAVAAVCYPVFRSDRMVSRREGIAFVLAYLAYFGLLIWRA
jgi:cation:H+ antiporter